MSYELRKPITDIERADFIVEYNHNKGLKIEDTEYFIFALESNEIMGEKEIEIEVPDFEIVDIEVEIHDVDEDGNYIYDEEGNPVTHTETRPVQEQIGSRTETIIVPYPVIDPNYEQEQVIKIKRNKFAENTTKAKAAIENGYIKFKDAEFETNSQTVGDLTATMLLLQATGQEVYSWLSRDDKVIELSLEDFASLGALIAEYKNSVWNGKYLNYKEAIETAQTVEELNEIVIDYTLLKEEKNGN